MSGSQPQSSSFSFPTDPTELAHWRRSGRYVPSQLPSPVANPVPSQPVTLDHPTAAPRRAPRRQLPWALWLGYGQQVLRLSVSPSGLFSASLVLLGLGLIPDLSALWGTAAIAQTSDEATPGSSPNGETVAPGEASAPQAVELDPTVAATQLFRSAPVPQWSVFEEMLNGLGVSSQRPPAAVEVAVTEPAPPPRVEVTAGDDRRGENLERAELFSASMINANLFEGNFAEANLFAGSFTSANAFASGLQAANLYAAKFDQANLYESDLREANLFKTDLRDANLYRADLTGANLFGADLTGANLFGANLQGANTVKANVEDALLCNTTMPDGSVSNRDCSG